jgi:quercetin dioxygenase-like cupin family protein
MRYLTAVGSAWLLCGAAAVSAAPDPQQTPSTRGQAATATLEAELPAGVDQIVHRPREIEWGPCPPGPLSGEGCGMAVLEGSPGAEQLFTFRIRVTKPFVLPPHTHPRNERVTVIAGAVHVGFGATVDKASSRRFEAGDFYVNRAGAAHFVWSDEPAILQLTGIGPWGIHPAGAEKPAKD